MVPAAGLAGGRAGAGAGSGLAAGEPPGGSCGVGPGTGNGFGTAPVDAHVTEHAARASAPRTSHVDWRGRLFTGGLSAPVRQCRRVEALTAMLQVSCGVIRLTPRLGSGKIRTHQRGAPDRQWNRR